MVQLILAGAQYIPSEGLGLNVPFMVYVVCVPAGGLFASLPLSINGLGVRETAYIALFGVLGVARPDAIALGLVWFACSTVNALPGLFFFAKLMVGRSIPFLDSETSSA